MLPSRMSWRATRTAKLMGMENPMPSFPPELLAMAVLMPTTSPRRLSSGPPLLPGIDRSIRLQKVLESRVALAQGEVPPSFGADNTVANRVA